MSSVGRKEKAPESPTSSIPRAYTDNRSDVDSAPSSIQSMLKNTTETGDIGAFSIKPSHVPYPISRASPSPRTSSLSNYPDGLPQHQLHQLNNHGHSRQRHTGDSRHNSLKSYNGTTASSIISLYQSESQKSVRPRTRHNISTEQRTFSMSQSSQFSYNLSTHRSNGSLRPRSPFAYPTRLKRPGYRPSSPALTDFNGTDARTRNGLDRRHDFRTPSPLSIYAKHGDHGAYPTVMNRSMPSLHRPPSPSNGPNTSASRIQYVQHKMPAPRSQPNHDRRQHGGHPDQGLAHTQPPSPSPLYYDYSEAFEEQRRFQLSNISVLSLTENGKLEQIPQDAADDEDIVEAREKDTIISERATVFNSSTAFRPAVESPSPVSTPNKFIKQMSAWQKEPLDLPVDNADIDEKIVGNSVIAGQGLGLNTSNEPTVDTVLPYTIGHHILSSSRPQTRERFIRRSARAASLTSTALTFEHPQSLSKENFKARTSADIGLNVPLRQQSTVFHPATQAPWTIPPLATMFPSIATEAQQPPEFPPIRRQIPKHFLGSGSQNIQVPVPERAVSSPESKDRLSGILSIDESYSESAHIVLGSRSCNDAKEPLVSLQKQSVPLLEQLTFSSEANAALVWSANTMEGTAEPDIADSTPQYLLFPQDDHEQRPTSHSLRSQASRQAREDVLRAHGPTYSEVHQAKSVIVKRKDVNRAKRSPDPFVPKGVSDREAIVSGTRVEGRTPITESYQTHSILHRPFPQRNRTHPPEQIVTVSSNERLIMPLFEAANIVPWEFDEPNNEAFPITKYRLRTQSEPVLSLGHTTSYMNVDGFHANQSPMTRLDVPRPVKKSLSPNPKAPQFKLRITRASSSTNGTIKGTRRNSTPSSSPRHSISVPIALSKAEPSGRENNPDGVDVDCSDLEYLAPLTYHETSVEDATIPVPHISVRPPSPNPQLAEVRSFFSDDSSNMERRSNLRQRISQFRMISSRANSTDEIRNVDRRQTDSATGRPHVVKLTRGWQGECDSVGSGLSTDGVPGPKYDKWKIRGKIKAWWHRGEDKLKGFGKKIKMRGRKRRSEISISDLYAGV